MIVSVYTCVRTFNIYSTTLPTSRPKSEALEPNHVPQLSVTYNIRLYAVPNKSPLLVGVGVTDKVSFAPFGTEETESKRHIRRHCHQVSPRVLDNRLIRWVETHGDSNDRRSYDSRNARRVRRGQEKCVKGIVFQGPKNTARATEVEILLIGGPELRGCVVEAEAKGGIPDLGVAIWVIFLREMVREV